MYRIQTRITGVQGAPYLSTFFMQEAAGTAQQAADAVALFWQGCDNVMTGDCQWNIDDLAYHVNAATGALTDVTTITGASGNGTAANEMLPPATQGLVSWRTGDFLNGREVRGRTFIPAVPEANNSDGRPDSGYITAVDLAAGALIGAANSDLVIWSKTHLQERVVEVGTVWSEFAVLRSRRD